MAMHPAYPSMGKGWLGFVTHIRASIYFSLTRQLLCPGLLTLRQLCQQAKIIFF